LSIDPPGEPSVNPSPSEQPHSMAPLQPPIEDAAPEEPGRRASETEAEQHHIVMPNDANPLGTVFGGRVMEWVDIVGAISAQRHCRAPVVLAALDDMQFLHPIMVGHIAVLKARVNWVGNTSIEVGVKVTSENPLTGELRQTSKAYLTYVARNEEGRAVRVPRLILETDEDRRRFADGAERRRERLRRAGREET